MRICRKCELEKPLDEFGKNRQRADGYFLDCKLCIKEYRAAKYKEHQETNRERSRNYRKNNSEAVRERDKARKERDREAVTARSKRYYDANAEVLREKKRAEYQENGEELRGRVKTWKENNPEKRHEIERRAYLKKKYNITPEEYEHRLAQQGGVCACCGGDTPGGNSRYFHIDHCHQTEAIRGILCSRCNTGIGSLGDTAVGVRKALEYLERAEAGAEAPA